MKRSWPAFAALGLLSLLFLLPMFWENAGGPCDAFERRILKSAAALGLEWLNVPKEYGPLGQWLGQMAQRFSAGQVVAGAVHIIHPNLPASLACTSLYWHAVVDPGGVAESLRAAVMGGQ